MHVSGNIFLAKIFFLVSNRNVLNIWVEVMQFKIRDVFLNHPLICFCVIHFLIWGFLPFFRTGAPMDSMEAVWWGKFCVWGTNKHPPLSGFPAYGIYLLFSENIKAVYILSQICITVGFCFIYKLASLLLEQRKAVLSVMLLEGCVFYGFCSPEYNVNVMSLALWPAVAYFFYRAVTENTLCLWCLAAIACAANFLNKYTCCMAGFWDVPVFCFSRRKGGKCSNHIVRTSLLLFFFC